MRTFAVQGMWSSADTVTELKEWKRWSIVVSKGSDPKAEVAAAVRLDTQAKTQASGMTRGLLQGVLLLQTVVTGCRSAQVASAPATSYAGRPPGRVKLQKCMSLKPAMFSQMC
mmetsp:Transcript_99332/g.252301  ORF Transcript_99332/g.252301 Transcript_99332/m.252301 type:complete len:113 (-) Transcript_99332:526-864(-)